MLNRLFKYNRFSTVLFLLSFFVSFLIMYYGLNLNRQFQQVGMVREEAVYTYGYRITGTFTEDTVCAEDIEMKSIKEKMPSNGNIIFSCSGPVGEGVINTNSIHVLWIQNEELTEKVNYADYGISTDSIDAPKCIVGDAWKKDTYVIDGVKYIKVFGIESCIVGEYVSNNFVNEDERCLIFKESLSQEDLNKLLFNERGISVIYQSNLTDEIEAVREWTKSFLREENFQERLLEKDVWEPSDGYAFALFMSLYQKAYLGMLLLCFINCAFLAYFWGETHIYEYMLKRTMGYGKRKLFADVIWQFAVLETAALGAVLLVTCGYEMVSGNLADWYYNIRLGFFQIVAVFILFSVALSLFPMIPVMRRKPAQVLKSTE